jgi:hypothetical protein
VPELSPYVIQSVKQKALRLRPRAQRLRVRALRETASARRSWQRRASGFLHPGGYAGPEELANLQVRLAEGVQPQAEARHVLLTVRGRRPPALATGLTRCTLAPRRPLDRAPEQQAGLYLLHPPPRRPRPRAARAPRPRVALILPPLPPPAGPQRPADRKYGVQIPVNAALNGYNGPYPMEVFQADYCE